MNFIDYTIDKYREDLDTFGLRKVWEEIIEFRKKYTVIPSLLHTDNLGSLYEHGLAYIDKNNKKEQGVYYTPSDVAKVLSDYLVKLNGENVCDVCCGVGNLILAYLRKIGAEKSEELLKNGYLYLYDKDELAIDICKCRIGLYCGFEYIDRINVVVGDFLDKSIHLPENSKVISNPPYYKITDMSENWEISDIMKDNKEFYSAFIEKIMKESKSSVLITPFSFIGGDKFYSLREFMNDYNGFILSFDNIPGNIFKGRKEGVFNSNLANSVRAAILVVENKENVKGFRVSPLIRFSAEERDRLLKSSILYDLVGSEYQIISKTNKKYYKCFGDLIELYKDWVDYSDGLFADILSKKETEYCLDMPKTCRYFVSATKKNLDRSGKTQLYFKDLESFEFAYCLLNSSFAYWYWRLYDGGITYPDKLLKSIPIFYNKLSSNYKKEVHILATEIMANEEKYLVYKKNANEMQENVKFPVEYRNRLNELFLRVLNSSCKTQVFNKIHSNAIFGH